jgi:hypothetical protein
VGCRRGFTNSRSTCVHEQPLQGRTPDWAASEFPTYKLNLNTGDCITHDRSRLTVPATQRVFHDEFRPSRLELPVIPR